MYPVFRNLCDSQLSKLIAMELELVTIMIRLLLLALSLSAVAFGAGVTCDDLNKDTTLPSTSYQMILVNGNNTSNATVTMCEKMSDNVWKSLSQDNPAVVGYNGIAQPGEKIEGDGKTPSGTFTVGTLFGLSAFNDPIVQSYLMDYRYIVDSKDSNGKYLDKFIDDPSNAYYNQWVSGTSEASSFEEMRISAYRYGFVINYNTYPSIVAGKGSAIFFHVRTTGSNATNGCVAMDTDYVIAINQWMDKDKQPLIRIMAN